MLCYSYEYINIRLIVLFFVIIEESFVFDILFKYHQTNDLFGDIIKSTMEVDERTR